MSQRETGLIKTVFNTDNLVMRISEKIADLVTVNLLFVLSCLPIVTIGIAKISLYQTVFAIKHQRRLPVIRTYINAFRENWKLGLQLGGIELLISGICLFDLFLFWSQTALPMQVLKAVCLGLFIFLVLVMLAAYPIAARYRLTTKSSDCIWFVFPMVLRYGGSLVASSYGVCDFCLKLFTRTHGLLLDWFF